MDSRTTSTAGTLPARLLHDGDVIRLPEGRRAVDGTEVRVTDVQVIAGGADVVWRHADGSIGAGTLLDSPEVEVVRTAAQASPTWQQITDALALAAACRTVVVNNFVTSGGRR